MPQAEALTRVKRARAAKGGGRPQQIVAKLGLQMSLSAPEEIWFSTLGQWAIMENI